MDFESVKAAVATTLPATYEPLLLTFEQHEITLKGGRIVIGNDYGTTLYLDPRTGHIESRDDKGQLPVRFLNSSLDLLRRCLEEYDKVRNSNDDDAGAVARLRSTIQQIDPAVFDSPESWWSVIIEQMEGGL
jgi:SUKH-4 immunity protein